MFGSVLESPRRGDSGTHPQHVILWRTVGYKGNCPTTILSFVNLNFMSTDTFA